MPSSSIVRFLQSEIQHKIDWMKGSIPQSPVSGCNSRYSLLSIPWHTAGSSAATNLPSKSMFCFSCLLAKLLLPVHFFPLTRSWPFPPAIKRHIVSRRVPILSCFFDCIIAFWPTQRWIYGSLGNIPFHGVLKLEKRKDQKRHRRNFFRAYGLA